jgi:hypothetical protein
MRRVRGYSWTLQIEMNGDITNMTKLKYIGKQRFPGHEDIRLWNIIDPTSHYNDSTRSLEGLQELGIIP